MAYAKWRIVNGRVRRKAAPRTASGGRGVYGGVRTAVA
jgi:hypothetical protein